MDIPVMTVFLSCVSSFCFLNSQCYLVVSSTQMAVDCDDVRPDQEYQGLMDDIHICPTSLFLTLMISCVVTELPASSSSSSAISSHQNQLVGYSVCYHLLLQLFLIVISLSLSLSRTHTHTHTHTPSRCDCLSSSTYSHQVCDFCERHSQRCGCS